LSLVFNPELGKLGSLQCWFLLQGIKIALKDEPVPAVMEIDTHVLRLYWTLERLQQQVNIVEVRVARSDIDSV